MAKKTFKVFGDEVEILKSSAETEGAHTVLTQSCEPGSGPPPHRHANEDEVFVPLAGEFELFDGAQWHSLTQGEAVFSKRGSTHTFRNSGSATAKMLIVATPGGLDQYLELISPLNLPEDMEKLMEISRQYGIEFILPA